MTQKEIAQHLGVRQQAVSKWFNGQSLPSAQHLIALAELLGKDSGVLFKEFSQKKTGNSPTKQFPLS